MFKNDPGTGSVQVIAPILGNTLSDYNLSACLREYAPSSASRRWPGLLSDLDCHDMLYSPSSAALVGASIEIPSKISRFMAESIGKDIMVFPHFLMM